MVNSLLTATAITREALRILHQKATFLSTINKGYDDRFAKKGAKIGDTLQIRLPNRYLVRDGITYSGQSTTERKVDLTVSKVKGVDLDFTTTDLTLDMDDFSKRVIEPAVSVLASSIEADVLQNLRKKVFNQYDNQGSAGTYAKTLLARKLLQDSLAPNDDRACLLNTLDMPELVGSTSTLFNDPKSISMQYREGVMGYAAGLTFAESTHLAPQSRGTANGGYLTNGATQTGAVIGIDTGTGTITAGEVVTFAGVYKVHPETKVSLGILQQFVVTADFAGGTGNLNVSPAVVATGAYQNVSQSVPDGAAVVVSGTAGTAYGQSLIYQKEAFTFATADLVIDDSMTFAARENFDGISMRLVKQYDITDDVVKTRLDVLYGYLATMPEFAARIANH